MKKILVIEDDEITRGIVLSWLKEDFEIKAYSIAEEAIVDMETSDYSLLLVDINLGKGINGVKFLKETETKFPGKRVPAIAITAYALQDEIRDFFKTGFVEVLVKPFTRNELRRVVAKHIL